MLDIFEGSDQGSISAVAMKVHVDGLLEFLHSTLHGLTDQQVAVTQLIVTYIIATAHQLDDLILLQFILLQQLAASVLVC